MYVSFTETGHQRRVRYEVKVMVLNIGHIKLEVPLRHESEIFESSIRYIGLELEILDSLTS